VLIVIICDVDVWMYVVVVVVVKTTVLYNMIYDIHAYNISISI